MAINLWKGKPVELDVQVTLPQAGKVVWMGENGVIVEFFDDRRPQADAEAGAVVASHYSGEDWTGRRVCWVGSVHRGALRELSE